jgi:hypothetical protein
MVNGIIFIAFSATNALYLQGFSSNLPLRILPGL